MLETDFHFEPSSMSIQAKIFPLGLGFLNPYLEPLGFFTAGPEEADFLLTMNNPAEAWPEIAATARRFHKPLVWWTIEDPNSFEQFFYQAAASDWVFTTDAACIPRYRQRLAHDRVFWLPLACCPQLHTPTDCASEATDFVISANWYNNEARLWGVETVVDPLYRQGYTITLFSYEHPSFMWPDPYRASWNGSRSYLTTREQYAYGCVVLGLNNQRSGMDGRGRTYMTSMRTFEALACGKPFLVAHSDAYERLGFVCGEHMVWVSSPKETLTWAERLLSPEGAVIAYMGREFVLSHHTYVHRLARIIEIVLDRVSL